MQVLHVELIHSYKTIYIVALTIKVCSTIYIH